MTQEQESLITYPTDFPMKIMGLMQVMILIFMLEKWNYALLQKARIFL
jgi:putative lipoic acid-binding regulatory protein